MAKLAEQAERYDEMVRCSFSLSCRVGGLVLLARIAGAPSGVALRLWRDRALCGWLSARG